MPRLHSCAAVVLLALFLSMPRPARADDEHYQDFPVGNRAAGLAGAYGAIADDPSGLFYNPAGIVDATRNNLSVSTNLYGVESTSPQGLAGFNPFHTNLNIIPSEVGSTNLVNLGARDELARLAWGVDLLAPSSRNSSYQQTVNAPDGTSTRYNTQSLTDTTLWAGAGLAYRVNPRWSFGLSAFFRHREVSLNQVADQTAGTTTTGPFTDGSTSIDVFDESILAILGAHLQWDRHWSFGFSAQTPSVYVRSGGQARVTQVSWAGGTALPVSQVYSADTSQSANAMKIVTQTNGGFRLAGAYVIEHLLTVTCDVTVDLPVTYRRLYFETTQLQDTIPLPVRVQRLTTANVNVGAELLLIKQVSIAGGFYTNRSSAPTPQVDSEGHVTDGRDALPHVDMYGGTVTAGYYTEHVLTRVGFTGSTGEGYTVTYAANQGWWVRQPLRETYGYVFVATTFRY